MISHIQTCCALLLNENPNFKVNVDRRRAKYTQLTSTTGNPNM